MKSTFRQSMGWLHTWAGLLLGWVSFAIFFSGTATYFRWEITQWMQPELRRTGTPLDAARAAAARLERIAPDSPQWFVDLPDDRTAGTNLLWRLPGAGRRFDRETLDPATGEKLAARDTLGGEFFYRFHFQLQLPHPWGRYLAGVAAFAMLVALISGIVTHRQFFADFFTFRAARGGFRSWLDFHNVTAVLALPFFLMITYSALVIFIAMYMPWGRRVLEPAGAAAGRPVRATAAASASGPEKPWIAPASLAPMLRVAEETWGADGRTLKRIEVAQRGTAQCVVTLVRAGGPHVSLAAREQLRFHGVTGAPLDPLPPKSGVATAVHDTLYGLHLARFAGPALRVLFFVMGLMGTALIATGLVLWTIKRRPQQAGARFSFGHGLVERLNLTTLAGLPLASAAFFWANRLLPIGLTERGEWEVKVFLGTWALALLHPLVRPVFAAWREQLWAGAALFLLLPALDACTAGEHLRAAVLERHWAHLGFDAAMFGCGLMLLVAARRIGRHVAHSTPPAALAAEPRPQGVRA